MKKTARRQTEIQPQPAAGVPDERRRRVLQLTASAWLGGLGASLAACGGGGGGGGGGEDAASGASPAAVDSGQAVHPLGVDSGGTGATISYYSAAIDSTLPLTVNGVQFDTSHCVVSDGDGNGLQVADLLPGMSSRIEAGAIRRGDGLPLAYAQRITVAEQVLGPVSAVDLPSRSFTVLGQRVEVTARTWFDAALGATGAGLAGLHGGQRVQVWGELDLFGASVVATRVGLKPAAEQGVVRGVLTRLDTAAGVVSIGALDAVFAPGDTTVIAAGVAVGGVVRARLSLAAIGQIPALLALREDALHLPDRAEAEIEGRVTRIDSATRFDVDGVGVDASAASSVQGAAGLALGARAEVHGRASNGLLRAASVNIEPEEAAEIEGTIARANAAEHSFVLGSVTVVWTPATVFQGGTAKLLQARRRAAVVGRWSAGRSQLQATRIELET